MKGVEGGGENALNIALTYEMIKIGMKTEINKGHVTRPRTSLNVLATVLKVFGSRYHSLLILYFSKTYMCIIYLI